MYYLILAASIQVFLIQASLECLGMLLKCFKGWEFSFLMICLKYHYIRIYNFLGGEATDLILSLK